MLEPRVPWLGASRRQGSGRRFERDSHAGNRQSVHLVKEKLTMMTAEAAMSMVRGAMLGALFTVMVLLSAPVTSSAQGPGTSYFACRDRAWADYNDCLMDNPDSRINGFKCFVAWDLDNIGCDLRLMTMQRD